MKNKIISIIKNPRIIFVKLDKKRIFKMSDKEYLKILYKKVFDKKLNLKNPKSFNEKMQWLKLYDRNPEYTKMVDKYEAKKYVSKIIGEEYIVPTLGIYEHFDEIDFDKLPNQFVIKCTHDSGGVFICKEKEKFDIKYVKRKIEENMKKNFFYDFREWPYKNIKPRIIVEEFIGENLIDYRFYCFNGKAKLIYMYINESNSIEKPEPLKCNIYDTSWNLQKFHQNSLPTEEKYECPKQLKEMIEISEKLSKDTKFLRVDLYIKDDNILFGELTFFPGAGFSKFYPEEEDLRMGEKLKII